MTSQCTFGSLSLAHPDPERRWCQLHLWGPPVPFPSVEQIQSSCLIWGHFVIHLHIIFPWFPEEKQACTPPKKLLVCANLSQMMILTLESHLQETGQVLWQCWGFPRVPERRRHLKGLGLDSRTGRLAYPILRTSQPCLPPHQRLLGTVMPKGPSRGTYGPTQNELGLGQVLQDQRTLTSPLHNYSSPTFMIRYQRFKVQRKPNEQRESTFSLL